MISETEFSKHYLWIKIFETIIRGSGAAKEGILLRFLCLVSCAWGAVSNHGVLERVLDRAWK